MKFFTLLRGLTLVIATLGLTASKLNAQTPVVGTSATPSTVSVSSLPANITLLGTVNNDDNNHFTVASWTGPGGSITVGSTVIGAPSNTHATATAIIPAGTVAGTYTFTFTYSATGDNGTSAGTKIQTVVVTGAVLPPNLWASSSDGNQISSFSVSNGTYQAGPTNMFVPSGGSTAALGRNDIPSPSNGYFYWLPNTSSNNGVVQVWASTSTGTSQTMIGSLDLNGASNVNLGFVRLGMGPDGTGWILAGDGTTLYLASFPSNGVNPVTISIVDASVTLVGGSTSTFQSGDLCVSGTNKIYALANNGNGLTQIFIGQPNGSNTTLTKKWDLVDQNNAAFTGSVNGVAFDVVGSLYISTATGLYYINQATVNGPAGTVQCSLTWSGSGLTDLASNVFPVNSALPVKLVSFRGNFVNGAVNLSWESAMEDNIEKYSVERSYNGSSFTSIGSVTALGRPSQYSYVDHITGNPSNIYYRLRISERSGYTYSSTVLIKLDQKAGNVVVMPNPFTSKVQFTLTSGSDGLLTYSLFNIEGKQVRTATTRVLKGSNTFFMNDLESLQPGIYMLKVQLNDQVITNKLIKK
jgi:hypothetical protein